MCLRVSQLQIVHHEFMTSESARKRYWARSIVGYSPFANAEPNAGNKWFFICRNYAFVSSDLYPLKIL